MFADYHKKRYTFTPKIKFTKEEDRQLASLVAKYGDSDWGHIASFIKGRNPRQCRERWNNYVNPKKTNEPWSEDEDKLLEDKYKQLGPKWQALAEFFPKRSVNNIKNRYFTKQRRALKQMIKEQETISKMRCACNSIIEPKLPSHANNSILSHSLHCFSKTSDYQSGLPSDFLHQSENLNQQISQLDAIDIELSGILDIDEYISSNQSDSNHSSSETSDTNSSSNDDEIGMSDKEDDLKEDPLAFLDSLQETDSLFDTNNINSNIINWVDVAYSYF